MAQAGDAAGGIGDTAGGPPGGSSGVHPPRSAAARSPREEHSPDSRVSKGEAHQQSVRTLPTLQRTLAFTLCGRGAQEPSVGAPRLGEPPTQPKEPVRREIVGH